VTSSDSKPASRRRDLALAVAAAVDSIPGVRRTAGSSAAEVSTLYPGGRVDGVSLDEDLVMVCVVLSRLPIPPVLEEIVAAASAALKAYGDSRSVEVVVDDLDIDQLPPLPPASACL
jgi:hypothetical protein